MSSDKLKRLTLIRHANAEQDADVRDFERPLSRKGRNEAEEMAKRFLERELIPDLILTSAAVRTRETADIFARLLGVPARLLQADDALYLADGEHILTAIRGAGPRVSHLMVICHNPGISAAAISLAPEIITSDLPTCGTLTMQFSCPWAQIDRRAAKAPEKDAPKASFFGFG
jgi:phosphohistidine phosphatase